MLRADQNFTDPGSKGRVLRHTSTNDYYVPGEYFFWLRLDHSELRQDETWLLEPPT